MTKPKGYFRENGKTKPYHEKQGITEDSFSKELRDHDDSAMGRIQVMKKDLIKEREATKIIHREPVIGYITNHDYGKNKQAVTLKVELRKLEGDKLGIDGKTYHNPTELSISGAIWNRIHSDCTSCGQNYDTLEAALKKHELTPTGKISYDDMKKLLKIWKRWHLNGMKSGTAKQNAIVDEYYEKKGDVPHSYEEAVKVLREHSMETDNGYKYGTAWRYEPLPEDVIKFAREIQEKLNVKEDGIPKE